MNPPRKSYMEMFIDDYDNPSESALQAAEAIDNHLFDPDCEHDLLTTVLEWIAEGWGYNSVPTPPMIAAALLNEAETYKADGSYSGAVTDLQKVARDILRPYIG